LKLPSLAASDMPASAYERKYQRWERAVEKADEEFTVRAARLLKWI
jgi:hypothetical protein